LKIYIAARYGRRAEMEDYANILTSYGHEITANWVYGGEEGLTREDIAHLDIDDVTRADCVLSWTEPYGSLNQGGGRHFELGLAYGLGRQCFIIGPQEIVFHHTRDIKRFETFEEAVKFLAGK
jgi:hypothetical protein